MKPTRVLYLDLDGTVRKGFDELGRYVNSCGDVELFPNMARLLHLYKQFGWRIVAVTNQGGVALGILSMEDMAGAVMETQRQTHDAFDQIMVCTHHPDSKDPEWANCWCRKPKYGNVILGALALAAKFPDEMYPPHLALFVGDRPEDERCAKGIGIAFEWAAEWRSRPHTFEI